MTLRAEAITDAAMTVLDEGGLDGLSMRAVAGRLGVQVGGLYYHVPDKPALLRAMADRVCGRALEHGPRGDGGDGWRADAHAWLDALRRAMLSWRDGARVVLEGPLVASDGALELMERLMATLTRSGLPASQVRIGADALMSYATGYVVQEQLATSVVRAPPAALAGLGERFPLVFGVDRDRGALSGDELFTASVELLLTGLAAGSRSDAAASRETATQERRTV
jgi:AcrR family transcriptional regulator